MDNTSSAKSKIDLYKYVDAFPPIDPLVLPELKRLLALPESTQRIEQCLKSKNLHSLIETGLVYDAINKIMIDYLGDELRWNGHQMHLWGCEVDLIEENLASVGENEVVESAIWKYAQIPQGLTLDEFKVIKAIVDYRMQHESWLCDDVTVARRKLLSGHAPLKDKFIRACTWS